MSDSGPPPKRPRTTGSDEPYELIYWPGIPGRGEFIRLLFVASGTPFVDLCNEQKEGIKTLMALIDQSAPDAAGEHNVPPLAPPIVRHGDLVLSQTPAILTYLGPRLGLVPPTKDDAGVGAVRVLSLALTALDGLSNEVHETHHPIATGKFYEDQTAAAKERAADYRQNRLPKFLAYFERVLDSSSSGGTWLVDGTLSYADLVLWQGLDGVSFAFPKAVAKSKGEYKKVWALYERVKELEHVKEYLASDRRQPYSQGIWRHYPELDEED